MTNVSSAEFSGLLAKGLGRAHLVIERGAGAPTAEALIAACMTNMAYDRHVERSTAPYLLELVRLCGQVDRLVLSLGDLLSGEPDEDDIEQRAELAGLLARDGVREARTSLYRAHEQLIDGRLSGAPRHDVPPAPIPKGPAREIIAIDGMPGALFVFGQLGRLALANPAFRDDDGLVRASGAELGAERASAVLANARAADPRVNAYLLAAEGRRIVRERTTPRDRGDWWDAPWPEAQQAIERVVRGTGQIGYIFWKWGVRASDDQIALAAAALTKLPRDDVELLRPYLCVFGRRPFPLDPALLISLIDDPREKVAWFALNALAQLQHPAVREAGLRIAVQGPLRERALDLLQRNWEPGDELIAQRLLSEAADAESIHTVCDGLRNVVEAHPSLALVPALLQGYERSPCSLCRAAFVRSLLELDALPAALRDECRWDASEAIRRLVT